jgi:FKBP-type peptidyl-prolyl cis-trans isomerase FklB
MKSISILTLALALGLFAGCTAKENSPSAASDDGAAFLAANAKKEGVITTASGLEYKIIKSGTGESPKPDDKVKVHYHGTLIDGTVFDSSVQRGEPIVFPVGAVIPGWVEALQLMKVGDKWQLFIPAKLAYGDRSPSPAIPANSVLIFEVELLGIEK